MFRGTQTQKLKKYIYLCFQEQMHFQYLKKELGTYAQLEKCRDEQQIIKKF